MDYQEIGSFAAVVLPVMVAFIWGGKLLLSWFTATIEKQQGQQDKLLEDLMAMMRHIPEAHAAQMSVLLEITKALGEQRAQTQREHETIVNCMRESTHGRP